jgi:DNA-binding NarL/FixJ family response regulator
MAIAVSIVEDNETTSDFLRTVLEREEGIKFLHAYPDAKAALAGIPIDPPEVLLMDINLPGMSGIECVARLKLRLPATQVLMLTFYSNTDLIFDSLRAGASGYLLKSATPEELIAGIKEVHTGGSPMSMEIARKVVTHFQETPPPVSGMELLSAREMEILSHLAEGRLYKEIASQLGVALSTVRTHLHTIYGKLQVQTRTEAVVKYLARK